MFAYITALLILYAFKNGDGNDTSVEYIVYTVSAHLTGFGFFFWFCFHTVWGEKKKKRSSPVSSESYSNQWRTQNIVLHYSTADERMCLIAKPSLFNILTFFSELLTDCSFVIPSTILSGSLEATVALWSKWTCQNKHCYKSKDFHFHFLALLLMWISHSTQASCF